jgi:gluconokinase
MSPAILSLDVGTTQAKAVLLDLNGREHAAVAHTYPLLTPRPGRAELDPAALCDAVIHVLRAVDTRQYDVAALALSTQGGSLLAVDAQGAPLTAIITWLDQRAANIVTRWEQDGTAAHIHARSGWSPQPGLPLAVLCALRETEPELFSAAARFLSVNDYLTHFLTGVYATNPSMAGEMLLTNLQTAAWDPTLCAIGGVRLEQLSPILPADAVIAPLRREICTAAGLPLGLPLINGGQDHACEALALGLMDPGRYLLACGTAWVLNGVTESTDLTAVPSHIALNPHVVSQRWIASQFLGGLGAGMEWMLAQLWQHPDPARPLTRSAQFALFDQAVAATMPGSGGLLFTSISGSPHRSGGFHGLRLDHTRAQMGRALLESAAFALRTALAAGGERGQPAQSLWMVGGATRSAHWPQIISDVTALPVHITQYSHGPALGAAMLAARGLGLLDIFPSWVQPQTITPNPAQAPAYDAAYAAYCQLTGSLL